jgi:imidazolonepropionase-like amidohydrolase
MNTAKNPAEVGRRAGAVAQPRRTAALLTLGVVLVSLLLTGCGAQEKPTPTTVPTKATPTALPDPILTVTSTPPSSTLEPGDKPATSTDGLVIKNGTIIDGTGADPISDGIVIIKGDRIVAVGQASSLSVPADAQVLDAQGGTILPGFINAHVHQGYSESNLEGWVKGGVTTVRDMGGSGSPHEMFSFRNARRDQPQVARLVAAGPFVSVPDGYPMVPWGAQGLTVTSPDDAREKTEQLLDDGADVVKVMMESGKTFGRQIPVLSQEEASAIVSVAHARGVPVTAHAMDSTDLERALDAGVDDIAHMIWDDLKDELSTRLVENDVYWVPTLELYRYVSADAQNDWDERAIANLSRFVAAGGKVALGTDFAGYSTAFQLGMPMLEIEAMLESGMTPMQIIVAATQNGAHVCNLGDEVGTLEEGKAADILVVDGDPLSDIQALARTLLVIHDGVVIREQ